MLSLFNCQLFDLSIVKTIATFAHVVADTMATPAPLGPPLDEATYDTLESAKAALQSHARDNGYRISIMSSRDQRTLYSCAKGGKSRDP